MLGIPVDCNDIVVYELCCKTETGLHSTTIAYIVGDVQNHDACISCNFRGMICRSVIDDQDIRLRNVPSDVIQYLLEVRTFIERRYEYKISIHIPFAICMVSLLLAR